MSLRGPGRRNRDSREYHATMLAKQGLYDVWCPICNRAFMVQRDKPVWIDETYYIECSECGAAWKLIMPGGNFTRIGTRIPGLSEDEYESLTGID